MTDAQDLAIFLFKYDIPADLEGKRVTEDTIAVKYVFENLTSCCLGNQMFLLKNYLYLVVN